MRGLLRCVEMCEKSVYSLLCSGDRKGPCVSCSSCFFMICHYIKADLTIIQYFFQPKGLCSVAIIDVIRP